MHHVWRWQKNSMKKLQTGWHIYKNCISNTWGLWLLLIIKFFGVFRKSDYYTDSDHEFWSRVWPAITGLHSHSISSVVAWYRESCPHSLFFFGQHKERWLWPSPIFWAYSQSAHHHQPISFERNNLWVMCAQGLEVHELWAFISFHFINERTNKRMNWRKEGTKEWSKERLNEFKYEKSEQKHVKLLSAKMKLKILLKVNIRWLPLLPALKCFASPTVLTSIFLYLLFSWQLKKWKMHSEVAGQEMWNSEESSSGIFWDSWKRMRIKLSKLLERTCIRFDLSVLTCICP